MISPSLISLAAETIICSAMLYAASNIVSSSSHRDAGLWPQPNPNIEIRNSKQIQNTNAPMFKTQTRREPWFWSFEFGSFDIVSDFVLRISDFQLLRKSQ